MTDSNLPDSARLNAVAAALRTHDAKTAAALAEVDLVRGVQHPILFNARALWLTENERHQDALLDFRRAAQLSPGNAAIWSAQGVCLSTLKRFDDAVEAFDRAIALQPNSAVLLCRKGGALEQARKLAAARDAYRRALELDKDNLEALGRLAFLAARQGAWIDARAYADRALRADPQYRTARLVNIMADIQEGNLERAEQHVLGLLDESTIADRNRILALGALGDLRDRQDRVEEAFQIYSQANQTSRSFYTTPTTAGGIAMSEMVAMLTSYFEQKESLPNPPIPRRPPTDETTHAFLLGFLRSGTTLMEQVLASHPRIVSLEEKGPIAGAVQDFMPWPRNLDALSRAPEQVLDGYRDRYWQQVRKHGVDPKGKFFVDKGPIHTVDIPVIVRLFPDAKILFAIRDPRDVVLSCFRTRFEMNSTTFEFLTLDGTAKFYAAVMRLAEIYRAVLPVDFYELRHESFVSDFETQARGLCDALGLPWDDAMFQFADRSKTGAISTVSGPQIARGLNSDGVGRWRRYADQLAPVLPVLQPWIERFGYPE